MEKQFDPTDFLIEKHYEKQPAWHNRRIVYRLKHWIGNEKRYEFEGDAFWLNNVYSKLRNEFGIENPQESVRIVDLTDF